MPWPYKLAWWTQGQEVCICNQACAGLRFKRSAVETSGWVMCFVLTVPLSTKEYKWVAEIYNSQGKPDEMLWGGRRRGGWVTMWWISILSRGWVVILLVNSCEKTISSGPGQATAQIQTLPNYLQPLNVN